MATWQSIKAAGSGSLATVQERSCVGHQAKKRSIKTLLLTKPRVEGHTLATGFTAAYFATTRLAHIGLWQKYWVTSKSDEWEQSSACATSGRNVVSRAMVVKKRPSKASLLSCVDVYVVFVYLRIDQVRGVE